MTSEFIERFTQAVTCRVPIIEVKTTEWFYFCLWLHKIFKIEKDKENQKGIYLWTPFRGFIEFNNEYDLFKPNTDSELAGTKDYPHAAVNYILTLKPKYEEESLNAIYVFRDFDLFYASPGGGDPILNQNIKDLYRKAQKHKITIVFCNSIGKTIPLEIQKEIFSLSMGYPQEEEVKKVYAYALNDLKIIAEIPEFSDLFHVSEISKQEEEEIIDSLKGLTHDEIKYILQMGATKYKTISKEMITYIIEQKQAIIEKSGVLNFYPREENIDSVGGYENIKEWLSKVKLCFSKDARAFGLPYPKGVLLLGVQGTGKSLLCKAIGGYFGYPIIRLDAGKLFGSHVGESESNMRRAIEFAESIAPAIFWLDEAEKSLSGVKSSNYSDGGTTARVFSTLLTWMNDKKVPVFIVATANDVKSLPPEILRKGRFDEIFYLDLPNIKEREEIIQVHLTKRNRSLTAKEIKEISRETDNFSGAELEQLIISGIMESFYDGKRELTLSDIKEEISRTVPLYKTMKTQIEEFREWVVGKARIASNPHIPDRKEINLYGS